jgi:hypothetical protein
MENVLSLMVVLFVLRMLFFIPLVNLDRMSLVKAQTDEYWPKLSDYLMTHGDSLAPASYNSSFGFDGNRILISESGQGDIRYIESLNLDGTITVVEHRMGAGRFDAMVVKGHSSVVGFSFGALRWSSGEQVWFTTNDSADYGNRPESVAMKKRFRDWTQKARGF